MTLISENVPRWGGQQKVYRFENGYGASVVCHEYSYGGDQGLWELAVIQFLSKSKNSKYALTYDTPITDDVIGYLTWDEVEDLLKEIEAL